MRSMVSTPPPLFTFTYLILLCTYIHYEFSVPILYCIVHAHTTAGTNMHKKRRFLTDVIYYSTTAAGYSLRRCRRHNRNRIGII